MCWLCVAQRHHGLTVSCCHDTAVGVGVGGVGVPVMLLMSLHPLPTSGFVISGFTLQQALTRGKLTISRASALLPAMPAGASSECARGTVRPATQGPGDRVCKRQVQLRPVIREPICHTLLVLVTMQSWRSWAMPTGNSPVRWRRLPQGGPLPWLAHVSAPMCILAPGASSHTIDCRYRC